MQQASCIGEAIVATHCKPTDSYCICASDVFLSSVQECSTTTCSVETQESQYQPRYSVDSSLISMCLDASLAAMEFCGKVDLVKRNAFTDGRQRWVEGGQEHWREGGQEHWRQGGHEHWRQGSYEHWRDGGHEHSSLWHYKTAEHGHSTVTTESKTHTQTRTKPWTTITKTRAHTQTYTRETTKTKTPESTSKGRPTHPVTVSPRPTHWP